MQKHENAFSDADSFIFRTRLLYILKQLHGIIHGWAFYSDLLGKNSRTFYLKPIATITSTRHAGTTVTFNQMNKYFRIQQMLVISSIYWNMIHRAVPEDVEQDEEGLHHACSGEEHNIFPEPEKYVMTNFIH